MLTTPPLITAKLQNEHPVLQTWVKTIKKTVPDEDGNAIVIKHDVYDRCMAQIVSAKLLPVETQMQTRRQTC
jgi:hypothetical protein